MPDELDDDSIWFDPQRLMAAILPEGQRPTAYLTPKQATSVVTEARTELFAVHDRLKRVVLLHELKIRKRWLKKTKIKREALLQEAFPAIPLKHAPEVKALKNGYQNEAALTGAREAFLLPFANVEDLCSDGGIKFLSLLHHRAHSFPSAFAQFDHDTLTFGILAAAIRRVYAQGCSIMCYGGQETYGKMIEWGDVCEGGLTGLQLEMRGDAFAVGEGLPVFEAQTKLLKLLMSTVEKLLWDVDLNSMPSPSPTNVTLPPPEILIPPTSDYGWESVARQHNLRAYLQPPEFSLEAFSTLVESQYELAVDRLVDLRTDPQYFAEQLQLQLSHRLESCASGARVPQELINTRALKFLVCDAYADFIQWYYVREAVYKIAQARSGMDDPPIRGRLLQKPYEEALLDVQEILRRLDMRSKNRYTQVFVSSPPLRQYFTVTFLDAPIYRINKFEGRLPSGDGLYHAFRVLYDERETHAWKLTRLYDEIDTALTEFPEQRALISPLLSHTLAQRGAVADAMDMITAHRPKVDPPYYPDGPTDEILGPELLEDDLIQKAKARGKRMQSLLRVCDDIGSGKALNLVKVAFPVSQFHYPTGEKTAEWAQKCEKVDEALSKFWAEADRQLRPNLGPTLFSRIQEVVQPHLSDREPWRNLVRHRPTLNTAPSYGNVPPLEIPSHPPVDVKPCKVKIKRRGEPQPPPVDRNQRPDVSPEPFPEVVPPQPISVPSRALKTLRMLFRFTLNEEVNRQQGNIPWSDVLHTFSLLGFSGIHTRGSVWRFTRDSDGRSFNQHAPHPESYLDFWQARRLGRRLQRRLGWTGDSFKSAEH